MLENKKEVKVFLVTMICNKCEGEMQPTGIMLASCPPQYPHVCNKCGHQINYRKQYPAIEYESL